MPADRGVEVEGLIVPPGTALLAAKPTGQKLTHVRGFIPLEPVDVRKYYERLQEDEKSYEFFLLEDEVIEAEAFFTDGTWRNYIKALVLCEGRSKMIAYVAPEDYGDEVNEPRASPSR